MSTTIRAIVKNDKLVRDIGAEVYNHWALTTAFITDVLTTRARFKK